MKAVFVPNEKKFTSEHARKMGLLHSSLSWYEILNLRMKIHISVHSKLSKLASLGISKYRTVVAKVIGGSLVEDFIGHGELKVELQIRRLALSISQENTSGKMPMNFNIIDQRELDRRAAMIDRLSDDMVQMRASFEKLVSSASEEDGSYTTYAEYDRLNSRATEIARTVDTIFSNSIEFTRQRTVMDRVIEEGRVHMEATQNAVKAVHSQLDEVKQQAAEQLRQIVEVRASLILVVSTLRMFALVVLVERRVAAYVVVHALVG